jgi:hypothetical protein
LPHNIQKENDNRHSEENGDTKKARFGPSTAASVFLNNKLDFLTVEKTCVKFWSYF